MTGLFGGYLALMDTIGGGVLYVLIGTKAWTDTQDGRFFRLGAGALSLGAFAGLVGGLLAGAGGSAFAIGILGAIVSAFLTGILEAIRKSLE
jgi:hypothetical protein